MRRSIALHALRGERVRLIVVGVICAVYAAGQVIGYRETYPTVAERVRFARVFSDNIALRLFYGVPHDLASVAGYAEFRVVGILAIVTAAWSVFAAIRALRGEEDAGRYELILAGAVGRGGAVVAVLVALAVECLFLWAMAAVGFLLAAGAAGRDDRRPVGSDGGHARGAGGRVRGGRRTRLPARADPAQCTGGRRRGRWCSPCCCGSAPTSATAWAGCAG